MNDGGGGITGCWEMADGEFIIRGDAKTGAIAELRCARDALATNYVVHGDSEGERRNLGDVILRYRVKRPGAEWRLAGTPMSDDNRVVTLDSLRNPRRVTVSYREDSGSPQGVRGFLLAEEYGREGDAFVWTIRIRNSGKETLEFGDVALPLPFNEQWSSDQKQNYEQRVYRHTCLAKNGSYFYIQRPSGLGPWLVMMPLEGTSLEYLERTAQGPLGVKGASWVGLCTFYLHAAASGEKRATGSWYFPLTSLTLEPGEEKTCGFRFRWAENYDHMSDILVDGGLVDVKVLPGMVIPSDLRLKLALRSRRKIRALKPEFPEETKVRPAGRKDGFELYEMSFSRLGPNTITLEYGEGDTMPLQFCCTEPLETLIKKHARFKVEHQQVTDPADGLYGAFLMWNCARKGITHPETEPGLPAFFYGTDDLGFAGPLFLSAKNVIYPDEKEIAALDLYLDEFIWNSKDGREMQDNENYGIWWAWPKVNATNRSYNYPHLVNIYLNMYRIQKMYGLSKYLSGRDYLLRAWRTAMAMYTLPTWSDGNVNWGLMGELGFPELIEILEEEGLREEAASIREKWKAKVDRMDARRHTYPYGSEISIDSTAFEAVHAMAKWGGRTELMEITKRANVANRGHQPAWFHYAGDNRWLGDSHYQLSYMTQLGGWALMDYCLQFAGEPERTTLLRLAYAAILASWAAIESGGDANEGAAHWVYHVEAGRGGWAEHDGEIGIGFFGGLRAAASVVADDPLFGLSGYGCDVEKTDGEYLVTPKDGVRQRLHLVPSELHLILDRDNFRRIAVSEALDRIELVLENGIRKPHAAGLAVTHPAGGRFRVSVAGKEARIELPKGRPVTLGLELDSSDALTVKLEKM